MALNKYFRNLLAGVKKDGWFSVGVGAGDDAPAFGYSVGFWEKLASPEVIIFGLPHDLMHSMLWSVFEQIQAGRGLEEDARWSDLIAGHDCISRRVHPSQTPHYLLSALWYKKRRTGGEDIEAFQIFWPGKIQGLFPWEPDCDVVVGQSQPALYFVRES